MKKYVKSIIALTAILIISYIAVAQNITTNPVATATSQKFEYCRLFSEYKWNTYTGNDISDKCWVQYNYNVEPRYKADKAAVDSLNNIMDGLNYLGSKGWN